VPLIIGSFNALPQRVLNLNKNKSNAYFKKLFSCFAMGLSPSSIGTLRGVSQAANQEILLKGFNMQGDPLSTTTSDERVRFTCISSLGGAALEIKSSKNLLS
jgi:hypothetical protein